MGYSNIRRSNKKKNSRKQENTKASDEVKSSNLQLITKTSSQVQVGDYDVTLVTDSNEVSEMHLTTKDLNRKEETFYPKARKDILMNLELNSLNSEDFSISILSQTSEKIEIELSSENINEYEIILKNFNKEEYDIKIEFEDSEEVNDGPFKEKETYLDNENRMNFLYSKVEDASVVQEIKDTDIAFINGVDVITYDGSNTGVIIDKEAHIDKMNNQEVQNTNNGNIIEDDPCKHIISYQEDQNNINWDIIDKEAHIDKMNNQEVQNTNYGNRIEDDPCKHIISYREDQNTSKSKILLDDSNFTEADIDDVFIEPNSSDDYNQNINNHIPTERMFKFKDSLLFWQTLEKTSNDSKNKSFNNRS